MQSTFTVKCLEVYTSESLSPVCPFPRPLPSGNHQLQNKKVTGLKSTA